MNALVLMALAASLAAPVPLPATTPPELVGSVVRVEIAGGLAPYESIRYEVFCRGSTAVVVHARTLAGREEPLLKTALLTASEHAGLWRRLRDAGLFDLPARAPAPSVPGGPRVTIEAHLGERDVRREVLDPNAADDVRAAAVVAAVREVALAKAGPIPFRDVFIDPKERGFLNLLTTPTASVEIDDRPTGERTPLTDYELPAGKHTLRLLAPSRGIDRRYDFRIDPGTTTLLELELR